MNNYLNSYYHGLAGNIVIYNPQTIINLALKQLDMIIKTKGLYSRKYLNKMNINYLEHKGVFNGDDYISVTTPIFDDIEYSGKNEGFESSYLKYTNNTISIVLSKNIENTCKFRTGEFDYLPGERQVKDKIPIDNFIAIKVSFENDFLTKVVAELVKEVLNNNNINLPIIDKDLNEIKLSTPKKTMWYLYE